MNRLRKSPGTNPCPEDSEVCWRGEGTHHVPFLKREKPLVVDKNSVDVGVRISRWGVVNYNYSKWFVNSPIWIQHKHLDPLHGSAFILPHTP
jgi:hypothetical protein